MSAGGRTRHGSGPLEQGLAIVYFDRGDQFEAYQTGRAAHKVRQRPLWPFGDVIWGSEIGGAWKKGQTYGA